MSCDFCPREDPGEGFVVNDMYGFTWLVCSDCKDRIDRMPEHLSYTVRKMPNA